MSVTQQSIFPTFTYRDAGAAVEWLARAFGFEPAVVVDGTDGGVAHAELAYGGSRVMLGTAGREGWGALAPPPGSGATYVVVEDADAHHAQARAAGAQVVIEPHDTDYGSRDYAARDLEGNLWSFGTYRPGAGA